MMKKYILLNLLLTIFYSCSQSDQFIVYPIEDVLVDSGYSHKKFRLYFNDNEIENEYIKIAVIGTDMYYYGQFFFDEIFMKILEKKVYALNGNAVIYNKNKVNYKEYDNSYLYFEVIQVLEKKDKYNER